MGGHMVLLLAKFPPLTGMCLYRWAHHQMKDLRHVFSLGRDTMEDRVWNDEEAKMFTRANVGIPWT